MIDILPGVKTSRFIAIGLVLALGATACAETFAAGAAVVNGVSISRSRLDTQVDSQLAAQGGGGGNDARLSVEREVLLGLIQQELIRQEARARGIVPTAADVDRQLAEVQGAMSDDEFADAVQQAGLTMETLREQIVLRAALDEIRAELAPEVTTEQLREVYQTSKSQFRQVKVSHILFRISEERSDRQAQQEARATLVELQAGRSFKRLARERSDDTSSAANGGALPGFTPLSQLDPGFAAAAESAKIGEVTDPVRSQFGWHLIVVRARRTQSFSAVRDQLQQELQSRAGDEAFQDFLSDLLDRSEVVVNPRFGSWDSISGTLVPYESFLPPEGEQEFDLDQFAPALPR